MSYKVGNYAGAFLADASDMFPAVGIIEAVIGYRFLGYRLLSPQQRIAALSSAAIGILPIGVITKATDGAKVLVGVSVPIADIKTITTVIGRVRDLQKLGSGERSLLNRLPDLGSPKLNWKQNSGVLRQEMNHGMPIRDASPGDNFGPFLNAERYLLKERGWKFDNNTNFWLPPTP